MADETSGSKAVPAVDPAVDSTTTSTRPLAAAGAPLRLFGDAGGQACEGDECLIPASSDLSSGAADGPPTS
ncbi:hypothetical protein FHR81_002245 [Actinoalloteichus hoggarensis]|uniref:Uncharacterized protein n=1 Tax=Actinoalloteichus hoggarensis TaxID=1470176 RepID=A0A221W5Y8_9PSEU|nr:hypothetical protein [Actinoalloteichus hoggarensis]ASO21275.1 hypothetical protein AHOG_18250 [Actinoalloteichus hoggarensis]MBB5921207.1 hypothetical protein [Actinoalloteichus hoggarensis]